MKSWFIILFNIIINQSGFSQLTLNQFFKSALDDPYYKSFELQNSYLSTPGNYRLPYLEQLQFRYRDNEFQNVEQRYALRIEPGNFWEISQNKKYFLGIKTLKSLEQRLALKEIMKERYEMVVEYWMTMELAELVKRQKDKREQISNAMAKKIGSADFDPDQYLNSQIDIITKEADWHEIMLDRDVALSRIMSGSGVNGFDLSRRDLITIDQIKQMTESESNSTFKADLDFYTQRIALSDQKIKLEKNNVDLGFLQAMYTDRENKSRSPMGVAFGINIPLFNNNKDEIAREKLDQMERQGELEKLQSDKSRRLSSTVTQLNLHFEHYQKLDSLISQFQDRGLNVITTVAKNYDPVVELRYQDKLIQFDVLKVRIKKEILIAYLNWLDFADKLQQRPLINYLSKDLISLEN